MTHDCYSTKRVTVWPDNRRRSPAHGEVEGFDMGYAIKYQDGHQSWCPADVFERDYQPITAMSFGHAIHAMKQGKRVARAGWNGKGMWLELQVPDEHSKMTLPYVYLNYPVNAVNTPGARVPWLASQTDMLADDWMILGEV